MSWLLEFTAKAEKQFAKLDVQTQQAIVSYMDRVIANGDPYASGKALVGEFSGYWRYRVGKYRVICDIQSKKMIIELVRIGKRDNIYD